MKYKQSERIFSYSFLVVLLFIVLSFSERKSALPKVNNYVIKNKATGMVLHVQETSNDPVLVQPQKENQKVIWGVVPTEKPNIFQLQHSASGKLLQRDDIAGNSTAFAQEYIETYDDPSLWQVQVVDDDYYKIILPGSALALTATKENSTTIISEWANKDNQQWELIKAEPLQQN